MQLKLIEASPISHDFSGDHCPLQKWKLTNLSDIHENLACLLTVRKFFRLNHKYSLIKFIFIRGYTFENLAVIQYDANLLHSPTDRYGHFYVYVDLRCYMTSNRIYSILALLVLSHLKIY